MYQVQQLEDLQNQQMAVAATGNILRHRLVASSTQTEPENIWVIGQYSNILMDIQKKIAMMKKIIILSTSQGNLKSRDYFMTYYK